MNDNFFVIVVRMTFLSSDENDKIPTVLVGNIWPSSVDLAHISRVGDSNGSSKSLTFTQVVLLRKYEELGNSHTLFAVW